MGPKTPVALSGELFGYPLRDHINLKHPLVQLADLIDWQRIEAVCSSSFTSSRGRPATSPRLVAGLLYLQHAFDLSDEEVVWGWVENPYWQVFTGETYLRTEPPIDPSSLTRWRGRLGEAGVEELLATTVAAAKGGGLLRAASFKTVIVDTTVAPKAVAHPTDSRLLERSREHLVNAAAEHGLKLRQNYNCEAPRLAAQIGRYAHARQFKRMNKSLRTLRSRVARVWRDIDRQMGQVQETARASLQELLARTRRILDQRQKDKNKLYALHAPEVECISKGKARTPYEFGVKVSIATTLKEGFVVGARSMPGIRILRSGQRRGLTRGLKAMIKRRSAIEPTIGHMKADGKLDRNWLQGALGDAIHRAMRRRPQHPAAAALAAAFLRPVLGAMDCRLCRRGSAYAAIAANAKRVISSKPNCSGPTI